MKKGLNDYCRECNAVASEKGFWDHPRNIGESLMLVVTELSEAMEAYRLEDVSNFNEEIADSFIRLFDFCGGFGIGIEAEIEKKMAKNKKRPYKHGKIC